MLYRIKHKTGYCLSRQGQEQPGGYVNTLCQHVIMLPVGIDEWDGNDSEICSECLEIVRSARGYSPHEDEFLRDMAQRAWKYGDRRGQAIFELALEINKDERETLQTQT